LFFPPTQAFHGYKKGPLAGIASLHRGLNQMKIILKENIENLGKRGDIINVAPGYGRNYLIPRKLAIQVTPSNMKMIEMQQKALRKKLEKEVESFQSVIEQLSQVSLSFERKAGDKDVIFGSVSTADIKEALDKLGLEVEKKKILLTDPIKRLGNFTVPIKVFHDERAEIKIEVKKEGAGEEEIKPSEGDVGARQEKEAGEPDVKKEEMTPELEPQQDIKEEPLADEAKEEATAEPPPEKEEEPLAEAETEEAPKEESRDQAEAAPEGPEEKPAPVEKPKPEESSEEIVEEKKDKQ
jgi:large subunit ribosomal protein L9